MKCPRCQAENRERARFCRECGATFGAVCSSCGAKVEAGSKFCDGCGAPVDATTAPGPGSSRFASPESYTPKHLAEKILTSKSAMEGERKHVTVLFADLKGSMELLADRDPEEARRILDPVLERMMEAVHRYEGTVNQVMGDGIMALFGAPIAHEDHAIRACYAALRMQEAVKRYAEGVRQAEGGLVQIRVGLNSGEVVVRSIGSDLHMDYTAVGQTTHVAARMEQMAAAGTILLPETTLQLATGFVEVTELGTLPVKGLAAAIPVYELTAAIPGRSRLHVAAGRGLTGFVGRERELAALHEAWQRVGGGHGQVVAIVGEPGVGKSRLYWEFIRSAELAHALVLETRAVSYGKATSYLPVIDLLKTYFQIASEDDTGKIREKVTGKLLSLDAALEPSITPILELLDVPVEDAHWQALDPPQRRRRTLEAGKRLLLREGQVQPLLLVFEDLHWIDGESQAFLDSLVASVPTARLLLLVNYRPEYQHTWGGRTYYTQLRIDALPPTSAGELLRAAAVIGKEVPFALLQAIADLPESELRSLLTHLQAGEFLYETRLFPDLEYTFKHALTHEVAYGSLLQERRRLLHARIVKAIEDRYVDRLGEQIESLAHHAFQGELWGEAVGYLRQAGAKAFARSGHQQARACFEQALRALECLPQTRDRLELAIDLRLDLRSALSPLGEIGTILHREREAELLAEALGDRWRLGRILSRMTQTFWLIGDHGRAIQVGERGLAIAEGLEDVGIESVATWSLARVYHAVGDYRRALEWLTRSVASLEGTLRYEYFGAPILGSVMARTWLVWSLAELGDFSEGVTIAEEALQIAESLGHPVNLVSAQLRLGLLHLQKGELDAATAALEGSLGIIQGWSLGAWFSWVASPLGF